MRVVVAFSCRPRLRKAVELELKEAVEFIS